MNSLNGNFAARLFLGLSFPSSAQKHLVVTIAGCNEVPPTTSSAESQVAGLASWGSLNLSLSLAAAAKIVSHVEQEDYRWGRWAAAKDAASQLLQERSPEPGVLLEDVDETVGANCDS